jgi:ABC-type transporter Mla MlaB component
MILANLALLRCQNRAQAFEDLAMDYCMKFEVSPPDWHLPLCRFESPDLPLVTPSEPVTELLVPELYGVLEGDHAMSSIKALTVANGLVIRCDRLVRCDAVATVALVRWAEAAKQQGHRAEFKNVHRLIESYFAAQGLTQHAKVTIRRD